MSTGLHKTDKVVRQLVKKRIKERDSLVARFMHKYPNVPIEEIILVEQITPQGFEFSVKRRENVQLQIKSNKSL